MISNKANIVTQEDFLCIKTKVISSFEIKINRTIGKYDYDDRLEYKKLLNWFEVNFNKDKMK